MEDGCTRTVHHGEALAWLRALGRCDDASVITSLPDVSEVSLDLDGWQRWFVEAAGACMEVIGDDGVAVFFQTDIRRRGVWIDKGALVSQAAAAHGLVLLFHKIVCRLPPGTPSNGRASYGHLHAFARKPRALRRSVADVLPDGGFKPGVKSMGVEACRVACEMVRLETPTRTVIDPFCGFGTVLATANAIGLNAIGVDHSARMVKKARMLQVDFEPR
jgi:hypothetical protein